MKLILSILLCFVSTIGQTQIKIDWKGNLPKSDEFQADTIYQSWKDLDESIFYLQNQAYSNGFLAFSLDSIVANNDSSKFTGYINYGKRYTWSTVELNETGPKVPKFIQGKWKNKIVSPLDIAERLKQTTNYFQENGYPFTKVFLDSLSLLGANLSARINVNVDRKIIWDTLNIVGDVKLQKYYLANYLGIQKGKPYNEKIFQEISKRLKELPFVTSTQTPSIKFTKESAIVTLYLKSKSANFINGVIGVLPNSTSALTNDESQLVVTGDLKMTLGNSFGYGKKIKLNWRRIQAETQQLNTEEEIPFILTSFIGLTHTLDLLKQDTSFINFKNRLGIKYDISAKQSFTAFWENEGTRKLSTESLNSSNITSNSGSKNAYGLRFSLDLLDYKYNPRKGIALKLESKAGIKRINGIKRDEKIVISLSESEDIATSLFVPETSMMYEGDLSFEGFIPIWKTFSLRIANRSGFKLNDYLLDNDLFRLGGFSLLRGFDQQSVFATNYSIFTTEIRLLFEENSHLNLFFDQSILQKLTLLDSEIEHPMAFGAGINFQTKPGIFSISYALGRFTGSPVEFSSAKIHFGFINLF